MNLTRINSSELVILSKLNYIDSLLKLLNYFIFLLIFIFIIISSNNIGILFVLEILLGLLFAHGLELQHEVLHGNMFHLDLLNRFFGFFLGVPMLVSYTHYKCQHLHHHKYLGTAEDAELFDYKDASLKNWHLFIIRAWNLSRVPHFLFSLVSFLKSKYPFSIHSHKLQQSVLIEYILLLVISISAVLYDIINHTFLFVKIWFIPWLVFGEVFHFLIELPEHIGCQKDTRDVTKNTRSIQTNPLIRFIVNSNNYHVEHHTYPKVSFKNLHLVNKKIKKNLSYYSISYFHFYRFIFYHI